MEKDRLYAGIDVTSHANTAGVQPETYGRFNVSFPPEFPADLRKGACYAAANYISTYGDSQYSADAEILKQNAGQTAPPWVNPLAPVEFSAPGEGETNVPAVNNEGGQTEANE